MQGFKALFYVIPAAAVASCSVDYPNFEDLQSRFFSTQSEEVIDFSGFIQSGHCPQSLYTGMRQTEGGAVRYTYSINKLIDSSTLEVNSTPVAGSTTHASSVTFTAKMLPEYVNCSLERWFSTPTSNNNTLVRRFTVQNGSLTLLLKSDAEPFPLRGLSKFNGQAIVEGPAIPAESSNNSLERRRKYTCGTLGEGVSLSKFKEASGGFDLVGIKSVLWQAGSILTVGFMNGTPEQQDDVKKWADEWGPYIGGIKLNWVQDTANANIRIMLPSADNNDLFSWSKFGTDALHVPSTERTMNFGWLDRAVVLHEFGHALGFGHEHLSPNMTITWNEEVVYEHFKSQNWSSEAVDFNVFKKYDKSDVSASAVDIASIMIYPILPEWNKEKFTVVYPRSLSATDQAHSMRLYPYRGAFPGEPCAGFAGIECIPEVIRHTGATWRSRPLFCSIPGNSGFDAAGTCIERP